MPPKNTPDLNQPVKKSAWSGFSPTISILLIVIVALIVGVGLYYLSTKSKTSGTSTTIQTNKNTNANTNIATPPTVAMASLGAPTAMTDIYDIDSLAGKVWTIDAATQTEIYYAVYPSDGTAAQLQGKARQLEVEDVTSEKAVMVGNLTGWQATRSVDSIMVHTYVVVGQYLYDIVLRNPTTLAHYTKYDTALAEATFATATNTNSNANVNSNSNSNANTNLNLNSNTNTVSWLTYVSQSYGVTFRYPSDWSVQEGLLNTPYRITVQKENAGSITFWLDRPYDGLQTPAGTTYATKNITLAGRAATRSETLLSDGTLFFVHDKFVTQPMGWGADAVISITPTTAGSTAMQDQILATLQITSSAGTNTNSNANTDSISGTAGWTTYTNSATGFSFQYPSAWFITSESTLNNVVSWIMESWDSSAILGSGGLSDGMVKADFSVSLNDGKTVDTIITCSTNEPQYTTIVSFETVTINSRQYKKCTIDSQVEGAHRSITLGTVANGKKYIISGFVPTGNSQLASLEQLDDVFNTFTIQTTQ